MGSSSRVVIRVFAAMIVFSTLAHTHEENRCASISQNTERLACYDALFGEKTPERSETLDLPVIETFQKDSNKKQELLKKDTIKAAQEAYNQIIADSKEMTITRVVKNKNKKVYFFTGNGRIFRKNTTRVSIFKINDSVELEGGALGAQFLTNQNGTRIKVKEIKLDK